jgi:hypothetical protein
MGAEDEHRHLDLTAIRQPPPTLSFAALRPEWRAPSPRTARLVAEPWNRPPTRCGNPLGQDARGRAR